MNPRYVIAFLLPAIGVKPGQPAPPASPAPEAVLKADVDVTLHQIRDVAQLDIAVPSYDLATHNRLVRLHAVLLPNGSPMPADADAWMASEWDKFAVAAPAPEAGGMVTIDCSPLQFKVTQETHFVGAVIREFEPIG